MIEKYTKMFPIVSCILTLYGLDVGVRRLCYMFKHPNEVSNRIACISFQSFILSYICSTLSLFTYKDGLVWIYQPTLQAETKQMEHYMAGYFIYDLIVLMSTSRGRRQVMFLIHHIVSLMIYVINQYYPCGNDLFNNTIILLLECSSPFMNVWKIAEELNPNSIITRMSLSITKITYFMSRMIGMTIWLFFYFWKNYHMTLNHTLNATSFVLVYIASIKWYGLLKNK